MSCGAYNYEYCRVDAFIESVMDDLNLGALSIDKTPEAYHAILKWLPEVHKCAMAMREVEKLSSGDISEESFLHSLKSIYGDESI